MKNYSLFIILTASLLISPTAQATSLLPINLQQLSTRATTVFHGVVTANEVRKDERTGHIATFTSFEIIEPIKGEITANHTIKQIGGYDKESNIRHHVHGVPRFKNGMEYIVFLPEASSLGFCSPLGLQQGSFMVRSDNGEKIVSNGHRLSNDHTSMLKLQRTENYNSVQLPLAVRDDKPTQSRLEDFINTVRAYNTP